MMLFTKELLSFKISQFYYIKKKLLNAEQYGLSVGKKADNLRVLYVSMLPELSG